MLEQLKQDFQYYLDNQAKLAQQYEGKVLVIKKKKILGVYEDKTEAIKATMREHELGSFLVQECSADPKSVEETIYSPRVVGPA